MALPWWSHHRLGPGCSSRGRGCGGVGPPASQSSNSLALRSTSSGLQAAPCRAAASSATRRLCASALNSPASRFTSAVSASTSTGRSPRSSGPGSWPSVVIGEQSGPRSGGGDGAQKGSSMSVRTLGSEIVAEHSRGRDADGGRVRTDPEGASGRAERSGGCGGTTALGPCSTTTQGACRRAHPTFIWLRGAGGNSVGIVTGSHAHLGPRRHRRRA